MFFLMGSPVSFLLHFDKSAIKNCRDRTLQQQMCPMFFITPSTPGNNSQFGPVLVTAVQLVIVRVCFSNQTHTIIPNKQL